MARHRRVVALDLRCAPELSLSVATDIERIALAEVRLLRQARSGDPKASAELLHPYEPGLWSIVSALNPQDARPTFTAVQKHIHSVVGSFVDERAFGLQLYGQVWTHLSAGLRPPKSDTDPPNKPKVIVGARSSAQDRQRVFGAIAVMPRYDALIWLFSAITGLSSDRLAELMQLPESTVINARRRAAWAIHQALCS